MRRALMTAAVLMLSACGRERGEVRAEAPAPEIVTVERPVTVVAEKRVYVPIDGHYTSPIPHVELPLSMCPFERDQLRAKLLKANGDRAAVRDIQGTPVKESVP